MPDLAAAYAGMHGDIAESAVAVVAIQNIGAKISNEQIGIAIVIEIGRKTPNPQPLPATCACSVTSVNVPSWLLRYR